MSIDEFRERLYELGAESVRRLNDLVTAQNNLFNEGSKSTHGFIDMSANEDVFRAEQAWEAASARYFEWVRHGHDHFTKKL
jgi:hypothetical protein